MIIALKQHLRTDERKVQSENSKDKIFLVKGDLLSTLKMH